MPLDRSEHSERVVDPAADDVDGSLGDLSSKQPEVGGERCELLQRPVVEVEPEAHGESLSCLGRHALLGERAREELLVLDERSDRDRRLRRERELALAEVRAPAEDERGARQPAHDRPARN